MRRVTCAAAIVAVVFSALFLLDPATAEASIITESTTVDSFGVEVSGQSFTTSAGGPWENIEFSWLDSEGDPFAQGNLYLFESEYTGTPSGLSSASYLAVAAASGGSYAFAPSLTLSALTQYFVYNDEAFLVSASGVDTYAGGMFYFAYDASSAFEGYDYGDLAFRVTGDEVAAVPEPASLTFLAVGLAGFGARRWRQRRPV